MVLTDSRFQGYHELLSRQHGQQEELSSQLDEQDVRKMEELTKVSQQEVVVTMTMLRTSLCFPDEDILFVCLFHCLTSS